MAAAWFMTQHSTARGAASSRSKCRSRRCGQRPVRRFLPRFSDFGPGGTFAPGEVFDLVLPLDQAAEGHRAMDERRAIETLLRV